MVRSQDLCWSDRTSSRMPISKQREGPARFCAGPNHSIASKRRRRGAGHSAMVLPNFNTTVGHGRREYKSAVGLPRPCDASAQDVSSHYPQRTGARLPMHSQMPACPQPTFVDLPEETPRMPRNLCRAVALAALLAFAVPALAQRSEPAKADHPIIAGFERFHAGSEDPVKGGRLLLGELNCTSCHAADGAWESVIIRKSAPVLDGVASRIRTGY